MKEFNFSNCTSKRSSVIRQVPNLVRKAVILFFFVFVFGTQTYAQAPVEYRSMIAQMAGSGDTLLVEEAAHIGSLVTDLHPTVYIGDVVRTNNGSTPVRADVKAGSISKLSIENPLFEQVELITIRINSQADLSAQLDLSTIQGFTGLKYVRLLCSFECTAEQLNTIVTGNTAGIKVFYSISIPS